MRGRTHAIIRTALAALAVALAAPVVAGPVQDAGAAYGRGDYGAMLAKIKEVKAPDWLALEALATQLGDSLYGEIAYRHLTTIRPDPVQPVFATPPPKPRTSTYRLEADANCKFALSYDSASDATIRLWSMPGGKPAATVSPSSPVWLISISQHYLAVEHPEAVNLYDVTTGSFIRAIEKIKHGKVTTVGLYFSPDGKQLLIVPGLLFGVFGVAVADAKRLLDIESGIELPAGSVELPATPGRNGTTAPDCPLLKQYVFSP